MASIELRRPPQHRRVIRVRNHISLIRAVIHALRERVRRAELQAIVKAASPGYLERLVDGICHIVRFPNRSVTFEWPQGIDVDAGVSRDYGCGRLVDVGLSLQVQATAAHVPNAELRLPEQLTLNSEIPGPRFRALERFALRGHYQRYAGGPARSGVIH